MKGVGIGIAEQCVVLVITDDGELARTIEGDVLEILQGVAAKVDGAGSEGRRVADIKGVDTFVSLFLHQRQFARLVKDIGIVAFAADHGVQATQTIEFVVAIVADQHVVEGVAVTGDVAGADKSEIFQVGTEGPVDRGLNGVDLKEKIAGFNNDIAVVIDQVSVVSGATDQGVGTCAAVENIIPGVAGNHVIAIVADAVDVVVVQ
ncbi:hypothetical protein PS925_05916 [Pseudomonas fluorescens]|uniref:Uncharacterized protein n=1 Tax=Pseudomonas fluorescens TaxID=294 RepID=A0A5E7VTQ9_PSEFL|nr:hypothetical protein PS925_05916 [Pseudomonas fluorescens]